MPKRVMITGNSSGLGLGLSSHYASLGWDVYGLSRSDDPLRDKRVQHVRCDLAQHIAIPPALRTLL